MKTQPLVTRSIVLAVFLALGPVTVAAQDGYMFRRPSVTLAFRGGASIPAANDTLFRFFTNQLTLDKKDFAGASWGADLGIWVDPKVDLVLGVAHAKTSKRSEFRNFEGTDDLPIEQTTDLSRTPATLSLRFYPGGRGRSVGRYAWIPENVLPYLGAGAGVMWYDLEQSGEFVDFETLDIFADNIQDDGSALMAQVFGGLEWWIGGHFGLSGEARYLWASPELKNGFSDFDNINLRGLQLTLGLVTRF
jgi:hypothetical protein